MIKALAVIVLASGFLLSACGPSWTSCTHPPFSEIVTPDGGVPSGSAGDGGLPASMCQQFCAPPPDGQLFSDVVGCAPVMTDAGEPAIRCDYLEPCQAL